VLQLYKPQRYQDNIQSSFKLHNLKLKLDKNFSGEDSGGECDLKGVFLKSTGLETMWHMVAGKITKKVVSEQLSLQPVLRKTDRPKPSGMPPLALFASKNLSYETVTVLDDKRRKMEQSLKADKIQIDANAEALLDFSPELIDLWFIHKEFSNKWEKKYKIKDQIPCDISERSLAIDNFVLIWNLSTSRLVSFKFQSVSSENTYLTVDGEQYVSHDGRHRLGICAKEA